jgi:hypothetical protein
MTLTQILCVCVCLCVCLCVCVCARARYHAVVPAWGWAALSVLAWTHRLSISLTHRLSISLTHRLSISLTHRLSISLTQRLSISLTPPAPSSPSTSRTLSRTADNDGAATRGVGRGNDVEEQQVEGDVERYHCRAQHLC